MLFKVYNLTTNDNFQPSPFASLDERTAWANGGHAFEATCFHHAMVRVWCHGGGAVMPSAASVLNADFQFAPNHRSNDENTRVYLYLPHRNNPRPTYIVVKRVP
jgi:hypothetical protein